MDPPLTTMGSWTVHGWTTTDYHELFMNHHRLPVGHHTPPWIDNGTKHRHRLSTESPRTCHGGTMDCPWTVHGLPWTVHGSPWTVPKISMDCLLTTMDCSWTVHGLYMWTRCEPQWTPWKHRGLPMDSPWTHHRLPWTFREPPLTAYGLSMEMSSVVVHGRFMDSPWGLYKQFHRHSIDGPW